MSLLSAHRELGWPTPEEVLNPKGIGAKVYAQLAYQKLARAISHLERGQGVKVGVLSAEPESTEAPLAIVCEFPTKVPISTLLETQRLAWNFSRSLLLITVEPHIIRKWTCCQVPPDYNSDDNIVDVLSLNGKSPEIMPRLKINETTGEIDQTDSSTLHWIELVSGNFFARNSARFDKQNRADNLLIENLKDVKENLMAANLPSQYIHDLLARIIFIQFLFDRKDSSGRAALSTEKLQELYNIGVLSYSYINFSDILDNYEDAYLLFYWLDDRFNGDLFPGKGKNLESRKIAWEKEKEFVKPEHLSELAKFVRGDIVLRSGQRCLWPKYAFDAIPLEFISSIYEEFVDKTGTGIHYTPNHIVDMMLDRVIPWDSSDWNIKVLDPACGSGIFLVKSFQRIIYRWKLANNKDIDPETLKRILENNLFGVDKDEEAVRVASFSLYLAMCDEIDPRNYWSDATKVQFPPIRDYRVVKSDFFSENEQGFRTVEDAESYDIIIGNPPWGDKSVTIDAEKWQSLYNWRVANKDFGALFIGKSLRLVKKEGLVCLIQSASALLYNQESTAQNLREKIFLGSKKIENVVNLAMFRRGKLRIFRNGEVATCIIVIRNVGPDGEAFLYECPKPLHTPEDFAKIVIEAKDAHFVYPQSVVNEPWVWSALMWGSDRDVELLRRLKRHTNIEKLQARGVIVTREGVNFGNRSKYEPFILGKRSMGVEEFSSEGEFEIDALNLDIIAESESYVDRSASSNFSAFSLPQLIIKSSWVQDISRFQAKLVRSNSEVGPVICNQSFISVTSTLDNEKWLRSCFICYNSFIAAYYLFLVSGRFAFDRSEPLVGEIRTVPIPRVPYTENITVLSYNDIDNIVFDSFGLQDPEKILVEDMIRFTLTEFKGRSHPGYKSTRRKVNYDNMIQEPDMKDYCDIFIKVMHAAYGDDKQIGAIIYSDERQDKLSMRMVSFYFNHNDIKSIDVVEEKNENIKRRISEMYDYGLIQKQNQIFYQRCIRTYQQEVWNNKVVVVVNIVKPDQMRYWTRSMALREADEVASDFLTWASSSPLRD